MSSKEPKLTLYHYWRSSSSWRVRLALKYKGLEAKLVAVDLLNGEVESDAHLKRNPLGYVPVLMVDDVPLIESVAIIEWLDETYQLPEKKLFPEKALDRAHVRALVEIINSETQPIQNLNVVDKYSDDPAARKEWMQFFITRGLKAYDDLCTGKAGQFSLGDKVTVADLFLIPQCYNALRFDVDLTPFPHVNSIYQNMAQLDFVKATHPDCFKP
jgi:maleylacetoacetate isomerase